MKKSIALFVLFVLAGVTFAGGMERTTRLSLNVGFSEEASAKAAVSSYGTVETAFSGSGVKSSIDFGKHIEGSLWGDVMIGVNALTAETVVGTFGTVNHTVSLMPIMVGLRTYLFGHMDTGFQPYLGIAGGPILGVETHQKVGYVVYTESHTETTLGAYMHGGVDFLLTSWLGFGMSGGYTTMKNFIEPISGAENFSGWDVSFGLSIFLGRQ